MWIFSLISSILAILSLLMLGLNVDYYLINKRSLNVSFANFFGLGLGTVTIFFMASAVVKIPVTTPVVISIAALSLLPIFIDSRLRTQLGNYLKSKLGNIDKKSIIYLCLFVAFFGVVAAITFSHPVWGHDAIDRWLAKANAFWIDSGITWGNLHGNYIADDPNLWPINAAWLFHFLGEPSSFWVQIIPFATFILLIGNFATRVWAHKWSGFMWIVILVFSPFLWEAMTSASYSGNADLFVSFYFLLAFGSLFSKQFVYSAIFFGMAALTKNEAITTLAGFCLLWPIFKIRSHEKLSNRAFLTAIFLLLFIVIWKYYYDLNSRYIQNDLATVFANRPFIEYMKYTLNAFREEFRFVNHWGIGFLVIFFFLATGFKKIIAYKWFLFGAILYAMQFMSYFYIYYVTKEDQATQIATSIFRIVLQLYPSLLLFAYMVSVYIIKKPKNQIGKKLSAGTK